MLVGMWYKNAKDKFIKYKIYKTQMYAPKKLFKGKHFNIKVNILKNSKVFSFAQRFVQLLIRYKIFLMLNVCTFPLKTLVLIYCIRFILINIRNSIFI